MLLYVQLGDDERARANAGEQVEHPFRFFDV
jgi:hypothetical protein